MVLRSKYCLSFILLLGTFILSCKAPQVEDYPNPITDKATLSQTANEDTVAVNELRNVYFGDLHVHTTLSVDAFLLGTLATPDDAYRFAQGDTVSVFSRVVKLDRPLDFCAITDHAEALGEMYVIQTPGVKGHNSFLSKYARSIYKTDSELGIDTTRQKKVLKKGAKRVGKSTELHHPFFFQGYHTTQSAWEQHLEAAEKHYQPGKFTTFAAYEWTHGGTKSHMHRNIIFRDMRVPDYPMSATELRNELELWTWLQDITQQGATVMAIPHNSNQSDGGTFTDTKPNGEPIDSAYLRMRANFEHLVEVHQEKGNSEVHAAFWKNDEFAGFENHSFVEPMEKNYVRYALKKGLEHDEHFGINPFKYGMIGSTDAHTGLPGHTDEDREDGTTALDTFRAEQDRYRDHPLNTEQKVYQVNNPGGLVAVWARANTRGHIYDALKAKETYATSGSRMQIRFFAGYDFKHDYESHEAMLQDAYARGVPMGGNLQVLNNQPPQFLIWAAKDPLYATLDRIQIIKGWYKDGQMQEKIYNVVLSDGRVVAPDGSVPDNGATVNMETGEWSRDKGDVELFTIWTDPDFDPNVRAFYYARVIEVPTASWRLWDQIRLGIQYPEDAELIIRERAWSSPIWYSPY